MPTYTTEKIMKKRRKKFKLPDHLEIPGGLAAHEVDEAISVFDSLQKKGNSKDSDVKLWEHAVSVVIATSEDFDEMNGPLAFMRYYYGKKLNGS